MIIFHLNALPTQNESEKAWTSRVQKFLDQWMEVACVVVRRNANLCFGEETRAAVTPTQTVRPLVFLHAERWKSIRATRRVGSPPSHGVDRGSLTGCFKCLT